MRVIPVISERAEIRKRTVKTGAVRVHKTVRERQDIIEQILVRESVEVARVPKNERVAGPQQIRQEGDTIVIPVVKQVARVETDWVLTQEIRLTRRRDRRTEAAPVTLREEHVEIERVPVRSESNRPGKKSANTVKSARKLRKSP